LYDRHSVTKHESSYETLELFLRSATVHFEGITERPGTFQNIDYSDTGSANGHKACPLLTVATIRITGGEIGQTLTLGHEKRFSRLILNQKITDIEASGLKWNTEHFETLRQTSLT
jgi:hypothetical protein